MPKIKAQFGADHCRAAPDRGAACPRQGHRARLQGGRHLRAELRDEGLRLEIFSSLTDARAVTSAWRDRPNRVRPHSSWGDKPPAHDDGGHRTAATHFHNHATGSQSPRAKISVRLISTSNRRLVARPSDSVLYLLRRPLRASGGPASRGGRSACLSVLVVARSHLLVVLEA